MPKLLVTYDPCEVKRKRSKHFNTLLIVVLKCKDDLISNTILGKHVWQKIIPQKNASKIINLSSILSKSTKMKSTEVVHKKQTQ